jgi:hypothetical protein
VTVAEYILLFLITLLIVVGIKYSVVLTLGALVFFMLGLVVYKFLG